MAMAYGTCVFQAWPLSLFHLWPFHENSFTATPFDWSGGEKYPRGPALLVDVGVGAAQAHVCARAAADKKLASAQRMLKMCPRRMDIGMAFLFPRAAKHHRDRQTSHNQTSPGQVARLRKITPQRKCSSRDALPPPKKERIVNVKFEAISTLSSACLGSLPVPHFVHAGMPGEEIRL